MTALTLGSLGANKPDRLAFKKHAAADGGVLWVTEELMDRLIFSILLDVIQQSWQGATSVSQQPGSFSVTAGYTKNQLPNGACSLERGTHCISLTQGLVYHLFRICSVAALQQTVFMELSTDGALHPLRFEKKTWFGLDKLRDKAFAERLAAPNITRAPLRHKLAFLLLFDALHIAWLHEAFHVHLGHCGFLRQQRQRLRMVELVEDPMQGIKDNEILIYPALEHEADYSAMRMATDLVLKGADPVFQTLMPELTQTQRLGILLVAGCLLTLGWRALEQQQRQPSGFHPKAVIRYYTLILAHSDRAEAFIQPSQIIEVQQWAFEQFDALRHIDEIFEPLILLGRDEFQKEGDKETEQLQQSLEAISGQLAPYRFTDEIS